MKYLVKRIDAAPALDADWDAAVWQKAETAYLTYVRPESKEHIPQVAFRVLHDNNNIYGIFQINDRFVRVVNTEFQSSVCKDSCVEFFFKPSQGPGYFNLEMNAGGAFLIYYVTDHKRSGEGLGAYKALTAEEGEQIKVKTTMPKTVEPEITEAVTWCAQFSIPLNVLENYTGKIGELNKQQWQGNFYKCADACSQPHWISWSPLSETNYHLPQCFANIEFA